MENPVLSYVFPWQWGHVVYLTADLRTEAWWLTEWCYCSACDHWVAVLSQKGGGWRLEENRGGLCSSFKSLQYSMSTTDWINMLNTNKRMQIWSFMFLSCSHDHMLLPQHHPSVSFWCKGNQYTGNPTHPEPFWLSDPIVPSGVPERLRALCVAAESQGLTCHQL